MGSKASFFHWFFVTVVAVAITPPVHADDNIMHVTVHKGYPGTAELLDGHYVDAEQKTLSLLNAANRRDDVASVILELTNNLCIAELLQLKEAVSPASCERAVHLARRAAPKGRYSGRPTRRLRAIAYSNRGVSRVLENNWSEAAIDFDKALQLNPEMKSAARNRNLVRISPRVAMVTVDKVQR